MEECVRCGCVVDSGKFFIPIDPKGTLNRRWVCDSCATLEDVNKLDARMREVCKSINPLLFERLEKERKI